MVTADGRAARRVDSSDRNFGNAIDDGDRVTEDDDVVDHVVGCRLSLIRSRVLP